jgi:hypothetical protein
MGLLDRLLGRPATPKAVPDEPGRMTVEPARPVAVARPPARDPLGEQLDALKAWVPGPAARLSEVRAQGDAFGYHSHVWDAADAIWTIVLEAWPEELSDEFLDTRDRADRLLENGDSDLRAAAEAVLKDIADHASNALRGSAMLGSSHLDWDSQNAADDRAMHQAAGAYHVARAGVLAAAVADELDGRSRARLAIPWSALCQMNDDEQRDVYYTVEEGTIEAVKHLGAQHVLFREAGEPCTDVVRLFEPFFPGLECDDEPVLDAAGTAGALPEQEWAELLRRADEDDAPELSL